MIMLWQEEAEQYEPMPGTENEPTINYSGGPRDGEQEPYEPPSAGGTPPANQGPVVQSANRNGPNGQPVYVDASGQEYQYVNGELVLGLQPATTAPSTGGLGAQVGHTPEGYPVYQMANGQKVAISPYGQSYNVTEYQYIHEIPSSLTTPPAVHTPTGSPITNVGTEPPYSPGPTYPGATQPGGGYRGTGAPPLPQAPNPYNPNSGSGLTQNPQTGAFAYGQQPLMSDTAAQINAAAQMYAAQVRAGVDQQTALLTYNANIQRIQADDVNSQRNAAANIYTAQIRAGVDQQTALLTYNANLMRIAADIQNNQNTYNLGLGRLAADLRGPRNAFVQQRVMHGLAPSGISNAEAGIRGDIELPNFQAPQAAPEPVTWQSFMEDNGLNFGGGGGGGGAPLALPARDAALPVSAAPAAPGMAPAAPAGPGPIVTGPNTPPMYPSQGGTGVDLQRVVATLPPGWTARLDGNRFIVTRPDGHDWTTDLNTINGRPWPDTDTLIGLIQASAAPGAPHFNNALPTAPYTTPPIGAGPRFPNELPPIVVPPENPPPMETKRPAVDYGTPPVAPSDNPLPASFAQGLPAYLAANPAVMSVFAQPGTTTNGATYATPLQTGTANNIIGGAYGSMVDPAFADFLRQNGTTPETYGTMSPGEKDLWRYRYTSGGGNFGGSVDTPPGLPASLQGTPMRAYGTAPPSTLSLGTTTAKTTSTTTNPAINPLFAGTGGGSFVSFLPKYQEGTDFVPETGPAILHEGEAVIPADQNPTSTSFGGYGSLEELLGGSSRLQSLYSQAGPFGGYGSMITIPTLTPPTPPPPPEPTTSLVPLPASFGTPPTLSTSENPPIRAPAPINLEPYSGNLVPPPLTPSPSPVNYGTPPVAQYPNESPPIVVSGLTPPSTVPSAGMKWSYTGNGEWTQIPVGSVGMAGPDPYRGSNTQTGYGAPPPPFIPPAQLPAAFTPTPPTPPGPSTPPSAGRRAGGPPLGGLIEGVPGRSNLLTNLNETLPGAFGGLPEQYAGQNPSEQLSTFLNLTRSNLPNPNKIVARNWRRLSPDTRAFLLAAYEDMGFSQSDIEDLINQLLPGKASYSGGYARILP
jgi:hypothetical protein